MNEILLKSLPYIEILSLVLFISKIYWNIHFRLKEVEKRRQEDKEEFLKFEIKIESKIDKIERQLIKIHELINRITYKK